MSGPAPSAAVPSFARTIAPRGLALMGCFGFASGLPLYLTFFTLQQWLSESHVSLRTIGAASLIGLPYLLKFLWAPVLDRSPPPPFRRLGRRRGWMLPIQLLLTLTIVGMSLCHPDRLLWPLFAAACGLAFLSASQDIVIDAWRIESFPGPAQAAALGAYTWGYRIAMLCSSAGAIGLAARAGWHAALLAMALLSLAGPVLAILAREPPRTPSDGAAGWRIGLRRQFVEPFRDLLGRASAPLVIGFVLVFNLGTQLADTMAYPFYHRLGLSPASVAATNGVPLLFAALAGAACSGLLAGRIGLGRTLVLSACLQMLSIGLYLGLLGTGPLVAMLLAKVMVENFAEGLAQTSFAAYLSRLCSLKYTATQFALLTSLAPVAWRTLGGTTGYMAEGLGWTGFYLLTVAACLPGIVIMLVLLRRYPGGLPPH